MRRFILACITGLALVGCDSPGGKNGPEGGGGGTFTPGDDPTMKPGTGAATYAVTEVCPIFARIFCFEQAACELGESTLPPDCLTAFQALCEVHIVRSIGESISAGQATYDPAAAARCFNGMTVTCDGTTNPNQADCDQILVGKIAVGQPCDYASSCVPGASCVAGEGGTCPGTCVAHALEGEACGSEPGERECASGLYCYQSTCVKEETEQPVGAPCSFSATCVAEAWCDYQEEVCKPRKAAGEACAGDQCVDGYYCQYEGEEPTCVPLPKEGEVCGVSAMCDDGLSCLCPEDAPDCELAARVCRDDRLKAGSPCDETDIFGPCGWSNMYCRASDNTCQHPPRVGEACGEAIGTTECMWGWCNTVSGKCERWARVNEACASQEQCLSGLGCVDGKCVAPPVDCGSEIEL